MLLLPVYHVKKPTVPFHPQCMKQGHASARFPRRWSLYILRYQTEKMQRDGSTPFQCKPLVLQNLYLSIRIT